VRGAARTRIAHSPAEQFRTALAGLSVDFFAAPLLCDDDLLAVPLPEEPGYEWVWRQRTSAGWTLRTDLAEPDARVPARPVLREGWLTLRPDQASG
jgi:hypothetical protein